MINFFSKHVIFGHVLSGQSVVQTIENLPVDPNTSHPLKDVVISHCGQLESVTSKLIYSSERKIPNECLENNKSKKRQISSGDENENDDDESSSTTDNDEKKKKSKHNKKSKKKEKNRRKKEAKRLAKKINENENEMHQNNDTTIAPPKPTIDSDDIPEQKAPTRSALNDKEKTNNEERIAR